MFIKCNTQNGYNPTMLLIEWINKMWNSHTVEYYSTILRNEVLIKASTWMIMKTLCQVKEARYENHILYDSIYIKSPGYANL